MESASQLAATGLEVDKFKEEMHKIDHCWNHDKATTDAHNGGKDANKNANDDRWYYRNIEARNAKPHFEGQAVDPVMFFTFGCCAF